MYECQGHVRVQGGDVRVPVIVVPSVPGMDVRHSGCSDRGRLAASSLTLGPRDVATSSATFGPRDVESHAAGEAPLRLEFRGRSSHTPLRQGTGVAPTMTASQAATKPLGTARRGLGATSRRDAWWVAPGVQATLFTICATYLFFSGIIWTPIFGTAYEVDGYLSPLFSPLLFADSLPWWISPGLLILWIPLGFRATCYYYRKAYYRFYFADPPGCAVGEPEIHRRYAMEAAFPFILQNVHRYFLYLAFIPLFFLWVDAFGSLVPSTGARLGLGSILFLVNVTLLTGYSLSCHSLRHIVGGKVDCFSCTRNRQVRHGLWQRLTSLNAHHMAWAWASLISVTLADVYVRLMALGVLVDPQIRL
jgi:hypothetical protein